MDNRVVIQYGRDIAAGPTQPAHLVGEVFVVTDAATAQAIHPLADILHYADSRPFVAAKDESLLAAKDAEKKASKGKGE